MKHPNMRVGIRHREQDLVLNEAEEIHSDPQFFDVEEHLTAALSFDSGLDLGPHSEDMVLAMEHE